MDKMFIVPKLSYEILNIPLEAIAANLGLTTDMLEKVARDQSWVQWFPEDSQSIYLEEDADMLEGEDIFTVKADQYLDRNRKRLQVYNMAKSVVLAELYAGLEVDLIHAAKTAINELDPENVKGLKDLSGVFKDLTKDIQGLSSSIQLARDEQGLPTVILRDLSGS